MPHRCVVGGCSNEPDPKKGIALHKIPFPDDGRGEARKRRRKWIDFVKAKRAKWEPTINSRICSAHFNPEDFERRFSSLPGIDNRRILIKDDIGIVPIPSIHAAQLSRGDKVTEKPSSTRRRRRVSFLLFLRILFRCVKSNTLSTVGIERAYEWTIVF